MYSICNLLSLTFKFVSVSAINPQYTCTIIDRPDNAYTYIKAWIGVSSMWQVIKAQIVICQSPSSCPAAPGRCPGLSEPYWSEPDGEAGLKEFVYILERDIAVSGPYCRKSFSDSIPRCCLTGCKRVESNPGFLHVKWVMYASFSHKEVGHRASHMLGSFVIDTEHHLL